MVFAGGHHRLWLVDLPRVRFLLLSIIPPTN